MSVLLTTLSPSSEVTAHRVSSDVLTLLQAWVVDCKLSVKNSQVHQPGILNPADPDFHGKLLQSRGWDFGLCQKCHGNDFSGGAANLSCLTCHKKGPQDCTTCHSSIAEDNAHGAHLAGPTLGHDFDCSECHIKPAIWSQPGHILDENGKPITTPPQVVFGALAHSTPAGSTRTGPPTFNAADKSCSNVYCHGGSFPDSNAKLQMPKWTDGAADATCGTCHGLPPQSHGGASDCALCHSDINESKQLTDLTQHITGQVALKPGITSAACTACHGGDDGNPAPPRDLEGNTSTSAIGVGAHQAHLKAPTGISAPMACGDCHLVPDNVLSAGHIVTGQAPSVFPATISGSGKAYADGATPVWDINTGTCTNTYCHGGGEHLSADTSPAVQRTKDWTNPGEGVTCGSCHGIPPTDRPHTPSMTLFDCATCHPGTIGSDGLPIVTTTPDGQVTSEHINGVIDYVYDGGF
jgi:predicted CxxxxCH...CXXCH cytochrome family protein